MRMNVNRTFTERLQGNAYSAQINRLVWIAASLELSYDLHEMLEEMQDEDWKEVFPKLYASKGFQLITEGEELKNLLIDSRLLGFLAQVHIPVCHDFTYENGRSVSWKMSHGHCTIGYVYGETPDELISAIEKLAKEHFKIAMQKEARKTDN